MSEKEEAPIVPRIIAQQETSTTPLTKVTVHSPQASALSAQEVERICKAFIRLITAKETNNDCNTSKGYKDRKQI